MFLAKGLTKVLGQKVPQVSAAALIGSIMASATPTTVFAQTPSPLPTRDELDPEAARPAPPPRRVEVEGDIERAPCALADPAYANIKVTLSQAIFNNRGPVTEADLRPAYAAVVGQELPIAAICDVRDAAASILRRKGYLAAVQVPVQRIDNGVVTFEVLYAKITAVRVLGDAGANEGLVQRTLEKLIDGQPFNRLKAERTLLLARDIPGQEIRLNLKPAGTGAGEMIGEVTLKRTPVQADLNIQNYAPRDTGRFGGQLRVQLNGLTGLGDRTTIGLYSTADFDEQQVLQLAHDMQLTASGLRLGGRYTYAWSNPSLGAAIPNVQARTQLANVEASYPLVRRLAGSLRAAAGFDYVNQRVRFGVPSVKLSNDRVRVGYIRLDGEAVDLKGVGPGGTVGWRLSGSLELRRGLSVFNQSPNCLATPAVCTRAGFVPPSLVDGDPTATVLRYQGVADLRVLRNMVISVQPRFQMSSAPLLAFEQFSTGNYTVGRGYEPGTLVGDSGAGFQTELRLDGFRLNAANALQLQPYIFTDNAWVWNRRDGRGADRLSSLGGGVRVNLGDRARLDATLAVPTRNTGTLSQRGDARFLISVTTNILPWGTR